MSVKFRSEMMLSYLQRSKSRGPPATKFRVDFSDIISPLFSLTLSLSVSVLSHHSTLHHHRLLTFSSLAVTALKGNLPTDHNHLNITTTTIIIMTGIASCSLYHQPSKPRKNKAVVRKCLFLQLRRILEGIATYSSS